MRDIPTVLDRLGVGGDPGADGVGSDGQTGEGFSVRAQSPLHAGSPHRAGRSSR